MSAGIYVHVPFCLTRCGYCDFNAYAGLDHLASRYVRALLARGGPRRAGVGGGGGRRACSSAGARRRRSTSPDLEGSARATCATASTVAEDAEVTIEANPDTVDRAEARRRCSRPGYDAAVDGRAVVRPRRAGGARARPRPGVGPARVRTRRGPPAIANVNLDLIYGAERRDARVVGAHAARGDRPRARARLGVRAHDRARDPARAQGRGGRRAAARPATCRRTCSSWRATLLARRRLRPLRGVELGASPGSSAVTTSGYWERRPYLGLGAGAHSYRDDRRWWNVRPPEEYLTLVEAGRPPGRRRGAARAGRRLPRGGVPPPADPRGHPVVVGRAASAPRRSSSPACFATTTARSSRRSAACSLLNELVLALAG